MITFGDLIATVIVGQAATTAVVFLVVFSLWRRYGRQHLGLWSASFACLFLFLSCKLLTIGSIRWTSPTARAVLTLATTLSSVAPPLLLVCGATALVRDRDLLRARVLVVLGLGLTAALVCGLVSLNADVEWRLPIRVGVGTAAVVGCLFAGAIIVRRAPDDGQTGRVGKHVVVGGFLLYSLSQVIYFAASLPLKSLAMPAWAWRAGFGDAAFLLMIGLGLVVWHLEEEHSAARNAWEINRRAEKELARARRLEVVGRLAARIAHDHNNLMMCLQGHSELARGEGADGPARAHLDEIDAIVSRATALTRQLLSAGSVRPPSSARMSLANELVSREHMLRALLDPVVSLHIEVADDVPEVDADPAQIEQIVLNLTLNARDALDRGGALEISLDREELSGERAGRLGVEAGVFALMSFDDNGSGLSPEAERRLFEPFFTTKSAGRGSGVGLGTVNDYVRSAGGAIEVDSQPGRGARFKVYLPEAADVPLAGTSAERSSH